MKKLFATILLMFFVARLFAETPVQRPARQVGFVENKGQFRDQHGNPNPDVLYMADFGGMKVQLRRNGFSYEVYQVKPKWVDPATIPYKIMTITDRGDTSISWPGKAEAEKELMYHYQRVDVKALGVNPEVFIIPGKTAGEKRTYIFPRNNGERAEAIAYGQVRMNDVYPGIDVVYYADTGGQGFKYDFVVHPDGALADVVLEYKGADHISINSSDLEVSTRFGLVKETIPVCYSEDESGRKTHVEGIGYSVNENTVRFTGYGHLGNQDKLVIDPLINWVSGTFLGGINPTISNSIIARSNAVFVSGSTTSFNNIATHGSFQDSLFFSEDGFWNKFDLQGTVLLLGTYLNGFTIKASDQRDNLYALTGPEGIIVFDTNGAFQWTVSTPNFQNNIVISNNREIIAVGDSIACFNEYGITKWKRSFGSNQTLINGVCIDGLNNVYITGTTSETTGISTTGSNQQNFGGARDVLLGPGPADFSYDYYGIKGDAFLAKLNINGQLIWSTYIGGQNLDFGVSLDVRDSVLVVTGMSNSNQGIATDSAFQEYLSPNSGYCFFQISVGGIPCPDPNQWFFCGNCQSGGYCPQPYDTCCQCADQFLMLFDLNGVKIWGTYLGDNYSEKASDVSFDLSGNIVVAGITYCINSCTSNLSTANSWMTAKDQGISSYCIGLSNKGRRRYGSYIPNGFNASYMSYGGLRLNSIYAYANNSVFLTGTSNFDAPLSANNAYRPANGLYISNQGNGFFIWLADSEIDSIDYSSDQFVCLDEELQLNCYIHPDSISGLKYQWFKNNEILQFDTLPFLHRNHFKQADTGFYKCLIIDGELVHKTDSIKVAELADFALEPINTGYSQAIGTFDFDNDHDIDILCDTSLLINTGGCFEGLDNSPSVAGRIIFSDVNQDNLTDIISLEGNQGKLFINQLTSFQMIENTDFNGTIAWGDFDNDGITEGFKMVMGWNTDFYLIKYINGSFQNIYAGTAPSSFALWNSGQSEIADIDNDGDIDIVYLGYTQNLGNLLINENGIFSHSAKLILDQNCTIKFLDYDLDGGLDILSAVSVQHPQFSMISIIKRLNNEGDSFPIHSIDTIPYNFNLLENPWLTVLDMNSDGFMDYIFGSNYYERSGDSFELRPTNFGTFSGLSQNVTCIADFDTDGDIDLLSNLMYLQNYSCSINSPPTQPIGLSQLIQNDTVLFSWQRATDLQTPQMGLTYNLRVGTTPGGNNIMSSMSDASGWRKVVGMGNVYQNTGWWLHGLQPGTYYWSVQAIDNSFAGGPFAPEQSFTILPPIPVNNFLQGDTVSNGESLCFDATNTITVGGDEGAFRVNPGANVTLVAGQKIRLLPETSVSEFGYLQAYITGNNEYCFTINQPIVASKEANTDAEFPGLQGKDAGKWSVAVYPNPVSEVLNVRIDSDLPDEPVQLVMYNLLGTSVQKKTTSFTSEIQLPVSALPAGIYLLSVVQGNHREIVKVLK